MQWSRENFQRLQNYFFTQILIDIGQVTFKYEVKRHIVCLSWAYGLGSRRNV
jgi:hypothetical protein